MARKHYDYAIIGSGICGLILAKELSKKNFKIALIESSEQIGGVTQPQFTKNQKLPFYLDSIATTKDSLRACKKYSESSQLKDIFTEIHSKVMTFENGKLQEFIGFGDRAPKFVEHINFYIEPNRLQINNQISQEIADLSELGSIDVFTNSHITDFESQESKIKLAVINDSKLIEVENYIFTASLGSLMSVSENLISKQVRQKYARANKWSLLQLQLIHSEEVCEQEDIHMLMGGTDKSTPCVGQFLQPTKCLETDSTQQCSQWISFVPAELTEDSELTANLFKEMKRQIKRAQPSAFDKVSFEKIKIFSASHCDRLNLDTTKKISNFNNLSILSFEIDEQANLAGRIQTAQTFLESLESNQAQLNSPAEL